MVQMLHLYQDEQIAIDNSYAFANKRYSEHGGGVAVCLKKKAR